MKKTKNGIRIITALCAALGWWGLLYPGLTLTPDTVRVVFLDENGEETDQDAGQTLDSGLYLDLLGTDRNNIRFRSRLLTELNALWEAFFMGQINKELMHRNAPIGVFDSGIGGLTVAREIMRQIPNEKIIYFGDTARVPYGSKSQETVTRYSEQIVRFLKTFQVKTIVIACNTASAYALDTLEQDIDIPIIGVLKPGAKTATEVTRNGRIGVIATEATISSQMYTKYISRLNNDVTIYEKACPLFVPLVEEGLWEDPVTDEIVRRYLTELIDIDIDTLILGCTHYPLIRSTLRRIVGERVTLVNPAYETAIELKQMLADMDMLNNEAPGLGSNQYLFYVSDKAEKFVRFANSIIKYGILSAKKINIEEY